MRFILLFFAPTVLLAGQIEVSVAVGDWVVRGEPPVPVHAVWIGLPQDAEEATVSVYVEPEAVFQGSVGKAVTLYTGGRRERLKWAAGTDGLYPECWGKMVGIQHAGGVKVLLVRLYGARVDESGYGRIARSLKVRVSYRDGVLREGRPPKFIPPLINPDIISRYRFVKAAGGVDVVVVAPQAVINAGALNDWVNYRTSQGLTVVVESIENIDASYGGSELAEKIRAYLKARHADGAFCALLVGRPDPDDNTDPSDSVGSVPMKMCWPRKFDSPDPSLSNPDLYRQAPTDFYYADLTGNWDRDGDGFFGEGYEYIPPERGDIEGMDFLAEMIVGRVPFDDPNDVQGYLSSVIYYEMAGHGYNFGSGGDLAWRRGALIGGGELDGQTPPHIYGEYLKETIFKPQGWSVVRGYRTGDPSIRDFYCTTYNFASHWNSQGFGVVTWLTHGDPIEAAYVFSANYSSWIPWDKGAFVIASSCQNGQPEDSYALYSECLRYGVVAFYGFTRVMWYTPGWEELKSGGGISLCTVLLQHLMTGEYAGQALVNAVWWSIKQGGGLPSDVYNALALTLYGDPLARIMWLDITPLSVGKVRQGKYVCIQLRMIGGFVPATFRMVGGMLPPGLSLSGNGLITGTPLQVGSWTFTVEVRDATGATACRTYTMRVRGEPSGCLYSRYSDGTGLWMVALLLILLFVWRRRGCSSTAVTTI